LVWGTRKSTNWFSRLKKTLSAISHLCVGEWPLTEAMPPLDAAQPLFGRINDNKDAKEIVFDIASGFLGSLEDFAVSEPGDFDYDFPVGKKLKQLRRDDQVRDVYLPVYLGTAESCKSMTASQKLLLQTVIRELTFPRREKKSARLPRKLDSGEQIRGDLIRGYGGKTAFPCPDLDPDIGHIGFNGNGRRRGEGYKLTTWMARAGYRSNEVMLFLADMESLGKQLGLTIGAVGRGDRWFPLERMLGHAEQNQGLGLLHRVHVRVYAPHDFLSCWNRHFGWTASDEGGDPVDADSECESTDTVTELHRHVTREGLQQQTVAAKLGVSKQYLSAVLRGKKPCSQKVEERIKSLLTSSSHVDSDTTSQGSSAPPDLSVVRPRINKDSDAMKQAALCYYDHGWTVLPMKLEGKQKRPLVRWKEYQERRPSRKQVVAWWDKWSDAGIGVVLGPVSGLLCVDVDGEKPHQILIDLLGSLPLCPSVKSGSADPFRYHLYFQHPDVTTKAKATPWNKAGDKEKLEVRGTGGLAVLPPSLHGSGRRYGWCRGRGYTKMELPPLPTRLLEALAGSTRSVPNGGRKSHSVRPITSDDSSAQDLDGVQISPSTAEFLSGKYAHANGSWNDRLFKAACDLAAREVPLERARPHLLRGASPDTPDDEQIAIATIESAYSKPREPGRS